MDPLIIHHVIRHRLSRIETNDFQDKSGCSINGFRSFLFDEGIVENLDDMEKIINNYETRQDYRGCPISVDVRYFCKFPLSDEILRMKNVRFDFPFQSKPIHKLVSPEPHFIEEERDLIENHFSYLGSSSKTEDIEEWKCFEMDNEGHLVSFISYLQTNFHLSNESIEHLSNFPHLRNIKANFYKEQEEDNMTNLSLLSNLSSLSFGYVREYQELVKDLGLFSNLLILHMKNSYNSSNTLFFNPFTKSNI